MIGRAIFTLLLSFGLVTIGRGADELRGKFVLSFLPKEGPVVPEAVEFMADGNCVLDMAGHAGVKAIFEADKASNLTIKILALPYHYQYRLQTYTLNFSVPDGTEFIYVRPPAVPHPEFKSLLGIFFAHTDLGDAATEITADHKFRMHMHYLVPGEKNYYDIFMEGTCTYADGIITYTPEHDTSPVQTKYLRDFVVKRDERGLVVIDFSHDQVYLESPAKNLDLPNPPEGYKLMKP